jgi:hypothetical protein
MTTSMELQTLRPKYLIARRVVVESRAALKSAQSRLEYAEDPAAGIGKALTALDRRIAAVSDVAAETVQIVVKAREEERPTMPTTDEVRAEVDRLATELQQEDTSLTKAAARAAVWKQHPDLVAASRNAEPAASEESVQSISQQIRATIDQSAEKASWQPLMENWGRGQSRDAIISKVRAELWRTEEGQALRDLDRAAGSKPYTSNTVAAIRKSKDADRFAKALEVLEHGFSVT